MEGSFQSVKGASSVPGFSEFGERVTALLLPGQDRVRLCGRAEQTDIQNFSASSPSGCEPPNLEPIL